MDNQMIELAVQLRHKRSSLLQEVAQGEDETKAIVAERESEVEELAQIDQLADLRERLNDRGQAMIREIDTALERLATGNYGECENCGMDIGLGRLRALPTATLCVECATTREKKQRSMMGEKRIVPSNREFENGFGTEEAEE